MKKPATRKKLLIEARRRGWVVVLAVLVVLGAALAIKAVTPSSSSAEAVLVVRAAGPLSEQPNSSTKLAATYARLIPLDQKVEAAVEDDFASESGWSYTMTNDPNTALLRLNFEASSGSRAIAGAKDVARAVTGPRPVSTNVTPRSIEVVRLPTEADSSGTSLQLIVVALALGLLLGAVLLAFWRPRDQRIDSLAELRALLACPCFEVDLGSADGLRRVLDALADIPRRRSAVVPVRSEDTFAAKSVCEIVGSTFGREGLHLTAVPGSPEAGELAAAGSDSTILVLTPGVRRLEVEEGVDSLGRYGASPAIAILASGRRPAQLSNRDAEKAVGPAPGAA